MGYYAIGIGGTGAKCVESLIHLTVAGLLPANEQLYILFVDPDRANGSLGRAGELLGFYENCRKNKVTAQDVNFLKNEIEIADPDVWTPLADGVNQLENYFSYNTISENARHVFDVLYTPEEKATPLDKGFRGHPSIGAAVLATAVGFDDIQPWNRLWEKIQADLGQGEEVRVILFGSIFGGTGASGLPTIARLLQKKFDDFPQNQKIKLGGVLMLPYFSFDKVNTREMKADSHDFLLNTQAALQYYYQQKDLDSFDYAYLIGCPEQRSMRASQLGGNLQKNDPHYAELFAALGAIDFFGKTNFSNNRKYNLTACRNSGMLAWSDLPSLPENEIKSKLMQMTRFAVAYLSTYYPMLLNISNSPSLGSNAPWYVDFFRFRNIEIKTRLNMELKYAQQICRAFLEWFANIEYSVTGDSTTTANLSSYSPFAYVDSDDNNKKKVFLFDDMKGGTFSYKNNFKIEDLEKLEMPGLKDGAAASLWERMCERYPKTREQNAWEFINTLYSECGKTE